jgi:CYTH domain-containing protein
MNNIEIERKFLVRGQFRHLSTHKTAIHQGYLTTNPEHTVRIRLEDNQASITIKGPANQNGFASYEYQYPIPVDDAVQILTHCTNTIHKTRYHIPNQQHTIEVDVFHGRHEGLIIAEIELQSEDQPYQRPHWLGPEVTGNPQYYNSWLSKNQRPPEEPQPHEATS